MTDAHDCMLNYLRGIKNDYLLVTALKIYRLFVELFIFDCFYIFLGKMSVNGMTIYQKDGFPCHPSYWQDSSALYSVIVGAVETPAHAKV